MRKQREYNYSYIRRIIIKNKALLYKTMLTTNVVQNRNVHSEHTPEEVASRYYTGGLLVKND